jgi:hypothetical protein
MMTSRDCIEEIRDAINQIEFYVELKLLGTVSSSEDIERRYELDIGRAVSRLVELRLEGTLNENALEKWHGIPADHSQGFITGLLKLTDFLKSKYQSV